MFLNEKIRILGLVTVRVAFKWARLHRVVDHGMVLTAIPLALNEWRL